MNLARSVNLARSAVVRCGDGQRVCSCPINEAVCEFTLDGSGNGPILFYSGVINGRGRFEDTIAPLSVFSVTYKLTFSIDGHTLRVIATDGKDIEHTDVEYILPTITAWIACTS